MKNKLYQRYGFYSNKGLRKLTLEDLDRWYKSNKGTTKKVSYNGFLIHIVWCVEEGISSHILKNNKLIAAINYSYKDPEELTQKSKKYIDYIKPLLSSCEQQ